MISIQCDQHRISQVQWQAAPEEYESDGDRNLNGTLCLGIEKGAPDAHERGNDSHQDTHASHAGQHARAGGDRATQILVPDVTLL